MRGFAASAVVIAFLVGLLAPVTTLAHPLELPTVQAASTLGEQLIFPEPVDTALNITEYSMIARPLLLPGGSTDSLICDINGDGRNDLFVAVTGSLPSVSVFYGEDNGNFNSNPSHNISVSRNPVQMDAFDSDFDGAEEIVVLERRGNDLDLDYVEILEYVDDSTYSSASFQVANRPIDFVVGDFEGDSYPDIALACPDASPEISPGYLWILRGPTFGSVVPHTGGLGSNGLVKGDFNGDSLMDLALANYYDRSVMIFTRDVTGMVLNKTITVDGNPVALATGLLNGDSLDDLAVVTENDNAVRFFYQSASTGLQTTEYTNRSLSYTPSSVICGDLDLNGLDDLVILSSEGRVALGMYQRSTSERWPSVPDFMFPTGDYPRSALIAQLDSRPGVDIAVSSARADWSGSSISIYPPQATGYSNSNSTIWTSRTTEASMISSGDIDGDGNLDLVLLYPGSASFGYMLDFSGTVVRQSLGFVPSLMLVRDLNGDGRAEILTTNSAQANMTISSWDSSSPGSFTTYRLDSQGIVTDVEPGDFNRDSLTDLSVITASGHIEFFFNTGEAAPYGMASDDSFTVPILGNMKLASGDFNSDGLDDLAYPVSGSMIGIIYQRENLTGMPHLPGSVLFESTGGELTQLWSGDVTGDGSTDIAAMVEGTTELFLFDQDAFAGPYNSFDTVTLPETPAFIDLVDATDDGHADIVVSFPSADLMFLYRQENGSLSHAPSMIFVTGARPNWAAIGDGTHDHRADLLVCDSYSHSVSAFEQINTAPVAHAGGPYFARQGDPLVLNGSADTGYSEIPFMEYRWDFGDGNVSDWAREPNPTHVYMSLGTFTITVYVRDPAGLMDSDSTTVLVQDSYPHPDFLWSPLNPTEGQVVTFTEVTVSFDPVVLLNWTIDGLLVSTGLETSISTEFDDGIHTIELEATDSDGSVARIEHYLFVQPMDPELLILADDSVDEGMPVLFSVTVDSWHGGPVDSIVSYEWNFSYIGGAFVPDTPPSTSNTTSHVFSASGTSQIYTVAVRVVDADGDSNISMVNIEVMDIGPIAAVSLTSPTVSEGVPFSFVSGTYSHDGIINWTWTLTYPDSSQEVYWLNDVSFEQLEFIVGDGSYQLLLEVAEDDGDTDSYLLVFGVLEVAPSVTLLKSPAVPEWCYEFETIALVADAESYDDIATYEWDFIASGGAFTSDLVTATNTTTTSYSWTGNYTAKVRVTDVEGSQAVAELDIDVRDTEPSGLFSEYIQVLREDPSNTAMVTFDASALAVAYPDITTTLWEFGDGEELLTHSGPGAPVEHLYSPTRNYVVNVTISDDDGNVLSLTSTLLLIQPTIQLIAPLDGSVVRSGTPINLAISDDTLPLVFVGYSVDGSAYSEFETQYEIDTSGWTSGTHSVSVRAVDKDGNIAVKQVVTITIDDDDPVVTILWEGSSVYGGDRINFTIQLGEDNVDPSGVILHITLPGDDSPSSVIMSPVGGGIYYALVEIPMRSGTLEMYVTAEDLAGNSATSAVLAVDVKLHFMDANWPYLLMLAVLAAVGTGAYFLRESSIAVDETFVIYNDGRLMAHSTRRLKPGMDDQILGSMFVAIQDFIKDSFKDETAFKLRKLEFGEKVILLEKGDHIFLAVVLHGKASKKVGARMKRVVREIENTFAEHMPHWDGDLDSVRGVNEIVKKLYSKAPLLPDRFSKRYT